MKQKLLLALLALFTLGGSNLYAQLENGTVYWIQDTSTGQFISGGASWGTQATVKDVGGLGFEASKISEGVYKLNNVMINKIHNLSKGLGDNRYVDNGSPAEWTLTLSGEGYTIKNGDNYLCNNQSVNDLGVKALGFTTEETEATIWKFLTKEEYDAAIQTYKDSKAANIAESMGLTGIDNVTDLESAITNAEEFLSKDVTSIITNPTLADNWSGWTHAGTPGSNRNEGAGIGQGCAEFWNGCGYATQTLSNIANGIYKIQFAGTYRPGNATPTENLLSTETSSPAFGFANNEKIELVHWIDVPAKANGRGTIYSNKEAYNNVIYTYVSDGTLKLGVVSDYWNNDDNYQWCPFGQFTLTYYTNKVSDEEIAELIATIPTEIPTAVSNNLNTLINTLESSKTISAYNALQAAIAAATPIAVKYNAYKTVRDRMVTIKDQTGFTTNEDATTSFDNAVTAQNEAVEEATTEAEIETAIETVRTAAGAFLGAVEITGTVDVTALIMNDTPTSNGDFWTLTGNAAFDPTNNVAEYWNQSGAFIKQTLNNLPKGYYTLTAVALARINQTGILSANENTVNLVQNFEQPSGNTTEGGNWFNAGNGVNTLSFSLENATNVEIGITADNATGDHWTLWRNFKLEFFGEDPLASAKALYEEALTNAQSVIGDETYINVTGSEATTLAEALETYGNVVADYSDVDGSKTNYATATAALNTAAQAVKDAAPAYNAYAAQKAKATIVGLTDFPEATDAAVAQAAVNTMKINAATYVATEYPCEVTELVGDLSTWTGNGGTGTSNNQHWSGSTKTYYEQGGDNWGKSSWDISYVKTVTLPAGKYMVKVAARGSADLDYSKLTISATENEMPLNLRGDSGKGITTEGNASFDEGQFANNNNGRGWEWEFLPFELTEETDVTFTLAAKSSLSYRWVSYCDFALLNIAATEADYEALDAAKPENIVLGFEEGEYAPYNNIEAAAALDLANEINTEEPNAQIVVKAATAALNSAEWIANTEEVNAIYDGTFAHAENNGAPAGWRMSNNTLGGDYHSRAFVGDVRLSEFNTTYSGFYIRFDGTNSNRGSMYYYGDTNGYTMPLKANTTYYVKVDFAGWGSTGKPLRMNVTGPEGFNAVSQQYNTTVNADASDNTPQQFYILFTTADAGNYVINFQTPGADTNTHAAVISNCELFKAKTVTVTISASATGADGAYYSSVYYSDKALQVPEGVECQTYKMTDGSLTVSKTYAASQVVPAGEGVVIKANISGDVVFVVSSTTAEKDADSQLLGVDEATTITETGYKYYKLTLNAAKEAGSAGFYWDKNSNEGTQINAAAHKVYLRVPTDNAAKSGYVFGSDVVDGIGQIENEQMTIDNVAVYNLNGQRVNKARKGIYIVNGKKVVIK